MEPRQNTTSAIPNCFGHACQFLRTMSNASETKRQVCPPDVICFMVQVYFPCSLIAKRENRNYCLFVLASGKSELRAAAEFWIKTCYGTRDPKIEQAGQHRKGEHKQSPPSIHILYPAPLRAAAGFDSCCGILQRYFSGNAHSVDGRNPFRTTLNP